METFVQLQTLNIWFNQEYQPADLTMKASMKNMKK